MGAEIKQTLERNYDVVLSAQEIRSLTFSKLKQLQSGSGGESPATPLVNGNNLVSVYYEIRDKSI